MKAKSNARAPEPRYVPSSLEESMILAKGQLLELKETVLELEDSPDYEIGSLLTASTIFNVHLEACQDFLVLWKRVRPQRGATMPKVQETAEVVRTIVELDLPKLMARLQSFFAQRGELSSFLGAVGKGTAAGASIGGTAGAVGGVFIGGVGAIPMAVVGAVGGAGAGAVAAGWNWWSRDSAATERDRTVQVVEIKQLVAALRKSTTAALAIIEAGIEEEHAVEAKDTGDK